MSYEIRNVENYACVQRRECRQMTSTKRTSNLKCLMLTGAQLINIFKLVKMRLVEIRKNRSQ